VQAGRTGERAPELALLDADRHRLAVAVENPRHDSFPAQAARLGRAALVALGDEEFGAFSGHSGGGV
jgi:hypothetical protein